MNVEIFQIATLKAMEAMWEEGIRDTQPGHPGDIDRLTRMYQKIHWQWHLDKHGDGKYREYDPETDHWMKWCGVGIANAYLMAPDFMPLSERCFIIPAIPEFILPSTYRINSKEYFARASKEFGRLIPPFKEISPQSMRPGDIVTTGKKSYGSHFRMCAGPPTLLTKKWQSIEANGEGTFPDGSYGEGLVRNTVKLSEVKKVWRPTGSHLLPFPLAR